MLESGARDGRDSRLSTYKSRQGEEILDEMARDVTRLAALLLSGIWTDIISSKKIPVVSCTAARILPSFYYRMS